MPDMLVGHGITDMVIDCTEFKFQHATDLDLNSLMFSNYTEKKYCHWQSFFWISAHGTGLLSSGVFSGSISDI